MKEILVNSVMDLKHRLSLPCTPSLTAKSAFYYLLSMGHFVSNPGYYNRRKGLMGYLLIYTLKGKGCAEIRGRSCETVKDQILLINCGEYHIYHTDRNDLWEFKFFTFDGSSSKEYVDLIYRKFGPVISMPAENRIISKLDTFISMIRSKDMSLEIKSSVMILDILTSILLYGLPRESTDDFDEKFARLESAVEFIEQNFSNDITVDKLAEAVLCSASHFTRLFKCTTGYSPYEYLIKYRINKAKEILKSSTLTVEEVAGNVGFDSSSNFIKVFKSMEGITPLKYRKMWIGGFSTQNSL